jgi:PEP-CTERM motif
MNRTWKLIPAASAMFLAAVWPQAAWADTLNLTLVEASQTVVQGTLVVEFDATISNPSLTETIYLNGDSSSTNSTGVTVDDSPFTSGTSIWPLWLAPGDSFGPDALFNVNLAPDLAPGIYSGVFSIQGGPNGSTLNDLADASFTLNVTAPVVTPEPASLLLLGAGLAILWVIRRRGMAET